MYVVVLKNHYECFSQSNEILKNCIDPYYIASNYLYHYCYQIKKQLNFHFKIIEATEHYGLLAYVGGLGTFRGINTLLYDNLGSKFTLQCFYIESNFNLEKIKNIFEEVITNIDVNMINAVNFFNNEKISYCIYDYQKVLDYERKPKMCCKCLKCLQNCPTKAIGKDYFQVNKCLRYFMDKKNVPKNILKLYKDKIMGCDICQKVCPHNKNNNTIAAPEELAFALKNKNKEILKKYLGKNLVNKVLNNLEKINNID